jgi:nucleotidyltransferase/DNA polymerase involved in DNA repair
VATASYEARKYGIHSAMPISKAYRLCPHAIYVRGSYQRYGEASRQVMAILQDFTPVIEKLSIDEAFLDVTGSLHLFGRAEDVAHKIKSRIRRELQLTASVGIAPNKFLAKIASDLQKPDGLVVVKEGEEKSFLAPLPIGKLWGVGKKTEVLLKNMGITTIGEIAKLPQTELGRKLGKWGYGLWLLANGIDERPVVTWSPQKSISQEITFDEDTDDPELLEHTLFQLADELARLMRKSQLKGRTITLKIRLEDFSTFTRSRSFSDFIDSTEIIRGVAIELFRNFDRKNQKVRLVGVGVSQLSSIYGEQLGLFEQEKPINQKLSNLLDSLKDKYGDDAVTRAALLP